jgi:hypothetical protein
MLSVLLKPFHVLLCIGLFSIFIIITTFVKRTNCVGPVNVLVYSHYLFRCTRFASQLPRLPLSSGGAACVMRRTATLKSLMSIMALHIGIFTLAQSPTSAANISMMVAPFMYPAHPWEFVRCNMLALDLQMRGTIKSSGYEQDNTFKTESHSVSCRVHDYTWAINERNSSEQK